MSTEQVDPQLVEDTKRQIRELVDEIADLAKSDLSPQEFYDGFLNRVVSALAAEGGAIWTTGEGNRIELAYQINFVNTRLTESEEDQNRHGRLLAKVLASGEPMLVAPHSGAGDDQEGANPTDFLLVLGPLMSDQEAKGVVEVFQRPGARSTTQRGYLRFLMQMCELAGDYLKTRSLRHFSDRQSLWNQLENFTREVHKSLDPRETAYTIANEGRRLIECDRVSVAIRTGRKCRIESVSGQDTFDKRSNTVQLLARLATSVTATGETVWYTGDTSDMAPQVEEAVQEYVDESHCKTVGVLPLVRPQVEVSEKPHEQEPPEVIGALIIEQIEDARLREGMLPRVEVVRDHSASAMANAREHNNLFLMPLWRSIGKATWILRARTLPKTLSVVGAIVVILLALSLVPKDFEMEGPGTLRPVSRRNVFSPADGGVVAEIFVAHGEIVKAGQPLLRLKNKDLAFATTGVEKRITAGHKKIRSLLRQIQETKSPDEKSRIYTELGTAEVTLEIDQEELKLIQEKQADLIVRSPIDGEVMTWNLSELLFHRLVEPGQVLMEIADVSGPWELEIDMPENKMGPVEEAQRKHEEGLAELQKCLASAPTEEAKAKLQEELRGLRVNYILTTDPDSPQIGRLSDIHGRTDVLGESGTAVRLRIMIDKNDIKPEERLPGTTVTARVHCGRRAVGYVWLRDVWSWVHRYVIFPM